MKNPMYEKNLHDHFEKTELTNKKLLKKQLGDLEIEKTVLEKIR